MPDALALSELEEEYERARDRLGPKHRIDLLGLGVPRQIIEAFGLIGVARIRPRGDSFEFAPDCDRSAEMRYILAVRGRYDRLPFDEPLRAAAWPLVGDLLDLVAFRARDPMTWDCFYGTTALLGCIPTGNSQRVLLYASPLDWLRSGGRGVCVIERDAVMRQIMMLSLRDRVAASAPSARQQAIEVSP